MRDQKAGFEVPDPAGTWVLFRRGGGDFTGGFGKNQWNKR